MVKVEVGVGVSVMVGLYWKVWVQVGDKVMV